MHKILALSLLLFSQSALSSCLFTNSFIDNALLFLSSLKGSHKYTYVENDDLSIPGTAEGNMLLNKYITLQYKPENGQSKFFMFAVDTHEEKFFIYHGSNLKINTTFYSGGVDVDKCSINFKVNDYHNIDFKVPEKKSFRIEVNGKEKEHGEFQLFQRFVFTRNVS